MTAVEAPWASLIERTRDHAHPWLYLPSAPHRSHAATVLGYDDLRDGVARVRFGLARLGVVPKARVSIVADNTGPVACCLLGILAAHATAVPVSPPRLGQSLSTWAKRVQKQCAHSESALVVAERKYIDALEAAGVVCPLVEPATLMSSEVSCAPSPHRWDPDDLALLQYTSGTTSSARAVMLTHRNLLTNIAAIGDALEMAPGQVGVSWLPLFHDMGLIGALLTATVRGLSLVLMRPQSFLMRPAGWLHALSRFGAEFTVAPNSAYGRCVEQLGSAAFAGLDLGHLRVALNGSEFVDPRCISGFEQGFEQFGLRPQVVRPVYGLAEHTVAVAIAPPGTPRQVDWVDGEALDSERVAKPVADACAHHARGVVSAGPVLSIAAHRVVDPDSGRVLGPRELGEVQLRGPCCTPGYFRPAPGTRAPIDAEGWLRTGDRGYVADGELYIAGRYKQLVKRLGRQIDCSYVEASARDVAGVRAGRVAAVGVPMGAGTEELVVVAETALTGSAADDLKLAIAAAVRAAVAFSPDRVVLVRPGQIPSTTSGKTALAGTRSLVAQNL